MDFQLGKQHCATYFGEKKIITILSMYDWLRTYLEICRPQAAVDFPFNSFTAQMKWKCKLWNMRYNMSIGSANSVICATICRFIATTGMNF